MMPDTRSRPGAQRGIVLVELTLLLPLLLLLVFVTAEFGRAFYTYNTLSKRVEDGARYLSQHALRGTLQDVELDSTELQNTRNLIIYGNIAGSGAAEIDIPGFSAAHITIAPSGADFFTVAVDFTYSPMFGSELTLFGLGDGVDLRIPLRASVLMRGIN